MYSARPAAKLEVTQPGRSVDLRLHGLVNTPLTKVMHRGANTLKAVFLRRLAECGETLCQEMAPIQMNEWRTRVFLEGLENDGDGVAEGSVFSTVANFLCPLSRAGQLFARLPSFCPADTSSSHLSR